MNRRIISLAACTVYLMTVHAAFCQEATLKDTPAKVAVQWRRDFNRARKEAEDRKLPMFLVFKTTPNAYVARYEEKTLNNPTIAAVLNERYVPISINNTDERKLLEALGIELFPTTMIAAPDGFILHKMLGFVDVDTLMAKLRSSKDARPKVEPKQK